MTKYGVPTKDGTRKILFI